MITRRSLFGAAAAALAVGAAAAPARELASTPVSDAATAAGDLATRARARIAALTAAVHAALAGDAATRAARVRAAVIEAFALDLWRRAVLGDAAAAFTPAQSAAVDSALPGYLAELYVSRFAGSGARAPEVGQASPLRRDVLVAVTLFRLDGRPLPLDYRVRDAATGERVIDVIVGGVSFALLKREEFRAILNRGGAEALIAHLRANAL